MSLKTQLGGELNRLANQFQVSGPAVSFSINVKGGRLDGSFTAIDQLACAFEQVVFHAPTLEKASMDQLTQIAGALAKRLSYLLESISPIETDSEGCVVQMRSNPPHKDDDATSYYELVVRRGEISLSRFSKTAGQVRRNIPANVTREVFYRLAEDLSSAASQP